MRNNMSFGGDGLEAHSQGTGVVLETTVLGYAPGFEPEP